MAGPKLGGLCFLYGQLWVLLLCLKLFGMLSVVVLRMILLLIALWLDRRKVNNSWWSLKTLLVNNSWCSLVRVFYVRLELVEVINGRTRIYLRGAKLKCNDYFSFLFTYYIL
jgi:UDP-N-acetylmuramyl pentapeptide phosphotransferase/UDP-N-acetylglucosamine-1-phosphate transferase